jgi:hypothetical protein
LILGAKKMSEEEKRLEAKKPVFYPIEENMISPFPVDQQVETTDLEDRSQEKRASMEMNRHEPEEALPKQKERKNGESTE